LSRFFPYMPEQMPGTSKTYIPGLDGIRAVAFLLVYVAHTGLGVLIPGGLGVTIFFFLSGYLITTLLRIESKRTGTISISQFYFRRTLRIFPPMYVTLAVWIILMSLHVFVGQVQWQPTVLAGLYLTNYTDWFTLHRIQGGLNILWSLSVEEHFYLLFPWLFLLFLRRGLSATKRSAILATLCFLALVWRCVLLLHFHSDYNYLHTDTRFDSILFGCLLAVSINPFVDRTSAWVTRHSAALGLAGLTMLLTSLLYRGQFFRDTFRYSLQGIALAAIFIFVLSRPESWVVRWLEHPALRLIGRRSYAMYLIHYCVIQTVEQKLGLGMFMACLVAAPPIWVYAWAMWHFVEEPLAALRRESRPTAVLGSVRVRHSVSSGGDNQITVASRSTGE
jgi:peptidoglycan/LPS O-acetylase OafA/YrhL